MNAYKGKGVSAGIAIGRVYVYQRAQHQIKRYRVEDPEQEVSRFEQARDQAQQELQGLYDKALTEVGESGAMIFQIHQMMLEDLDYCDSVCNMIRTQQVNAEYAVGATGDNFARMFSEMEDEYMKGRAADVKDVSERVVKVLLGGGDSLIASEEPVIVAADDLAPSETVQMDKSKVLGFLTREGSGSSHTAILARTMGIPAVIGLGDQYSVEMDGKMAAIDGVTGSVYLEPDEDTMVRMQAKKQADEEQKALLQTLKGQANVTLDGQTIDLYANIGNVADVAAVLEGDAGGIGLFRSEFLYLENSDYPTEEEQFTAYKSVAEIMAGKRIIIRTLDIGADKQVEYFDMPHEENPAMGYRAIRICLDRPEVFKTQLRALYRASAYGNIAIMFPMIISVEEVRQIKQIVAQVKASLQADGIPFNDQVPLGIMIETPAAAIISDLLAKEVDFFSIGTNDLSQYTMAVDRQNNKLDKTFNPHHKAVLRLIKQVADNAHKNGIWVGICGELGADLSLTEAFLAMGIDELSVTPGSVLALRKKVRETDVSKIRQSALEELL
ncbi:MAG: phosphoenolpyruvate--protein phosphotransferase [Eubacteriales bacterium]